MKWLVFALLLLPGAAHAAEPLGAISALTAGKAPLSLSLQVLLLMSLLATGVLQGDNRGKTYVPAETSPDGRVTPGHFE